MKDKEKMMVDVVFVVAAGGETVIANFARSQPLEEVRAFWRGEEGQRVVTSVTLDPKWADTDALSLLHSLIGLSHDSDGVAQLLNEMLAQAFAAGRVSICIR